LNIPAKSTSGAGRSCEVTRASLHASGWETWYTRAGSGAPVVLLADLTNPAEARLFLALARSHRVLAPERPAPVTLRASADAVSEQESAVAFDPPSWLRDFVDGLGVVPVTLVVTDTSLAAAAFQLALADCARVGRLILLNDTRDADDDANAVADFTTLDLGLEMKE
jgi:pimeloyl-ACP methyl ester carboxylesterase